MEVEYIFVKEEGEGRMGTMWEHPDITAGQGTHRTLNPAAFLWTEHTPSGIKAYACGTQRLCVFVLSEDILRVCKSPWMHNWWSAIYWEGNSGRGRYSVFPHGGAEWIIHQRKRPPWETIYEESQEGTEDASSTYVSRLLLREMEAKCL